MHSIEILSANTLIIRFAYDDHERNARCVFSVKDYCEKHWRTQLVDIVPAYNSLTLHVDFPVLTPQALKQILNEQLVYILQAEHNNLPPQRTITIPCCYDPDVALDINKVAQHTGLTTSDIVEQHCAQTYRVYAVGFSPGFPYLGDLPEALQIPRLSTPRTHVAAGSVAIAERQTGIYSQNSPGGWHIIGQTPLSLFHITANSKKLYHCLLLSGDNVRFQTIDLTHYLNMGNNT